MPGSDCPQRWPRRGLEGRLFRLAAVGVRVVVHVAFVRVLAFGVPVREVGVIEGRVVVLVVVNGDEVFDVTPCSPSCVVGDVDVLVVVNGRAVGVGLVTGLHGGLLSGGACPPRRSNLDQVRGVAGSY